MGHNDECFGEDVHMCVRRETFMAMMTTTTTTKDD